eukprot:4702559-Amphidinium_carterae.1
MGHTHALTVICCPRDQLVRDPSKGGILPYGVSFAKPGYANASRFLEEELNASMWLSECECKCKSNLKSVVC